MDFVRVCDGLFPLPVEEKAVSWTLLPLRNCLFPLREKEKAKLTVSKGINCFRPGACWVKLLQKKK